MTPLPHLAAARWRARLVLRIEALVPALAPSAAIAGLWMAAALFGLPTLLPPLLAAPVTAAALAALLVLAWRRIRRLTPAPVAALDRRIEQASHLAHRPLAALADRRAAGTAALWDIHQARLAGSLGQLRAGLPHPALAPHDRLGLRFIVPAALVAGLLVAREDAGALLLAAAAPGIAPIPGPAGNLQAWISPPAFTGLAPVFLHAGSGETARVPEGSVLTASLTGSAATPHLAGGRRKPARFSSLGDGSFQLAEPLDRSGPIRIRQGGHLVASWNVTVIPLGVPAVGWTANPGPAHSSWRTALPWRVAYPYGVTAVTAELRPVGVPGAPPITVTIPLEGDPHDARGIETPDLSASPFAGAEVAATLVARDTHGDVGRSDTRRFTLPARPFHNPLARAVVDTRRRLALHPDDHESAAADLAALGEVPHVFDHVGASGTYLNLEAVAALLRTRPDNSANAEAEDRLWELALLLEDASHEGAAAARSALAMRAAREAVDQQLQHMRALGPRGQTPAAQSELARRVDALKRAIQQRMRDLMAEALKQGTVLPPDAAAGAKGADALSRAMQHLDDAARAGRPEDAARALSQMEDMLDRMRPATPDEVRQALASMAATQQAAKQMQALADMVKREGQLLDSAEKRAGNPAGPPPPPSTNAPGQDQDGAAPTDPRDGERRTEHALGRAADALAAQFGALAGKKPEALGRARAAMSAAESALGRGDDTAAAGAEREALRDLQSGGQQMSNTLRSKSRSASGATAFVPGFAPGGEGGTSGDPNASEDGDDDAQNAARDPLGRRLTGNGRATGDDTELALPDESARARNRQIEEELRRRDSDRERPADELRYLDRLLQAF